MFNLACTGTAKVQEAIALGASWASQKIMEQSKRWQQQIEPAHPVQISPELKVLLFSTFDRIGNMVFNIFGRPPHSRRHAM